MLAVKCRRRHFRVVLALAASVIVANNHSLAAAEQSATLTLRQALARALATNPRLTAAERDVGIAAGKKIQTGAVPNPELSFELDNAFGSGDYRGTRSAETTLQLSQLVELGGKRNARVAVGSAELDQAGWQRQATRLEVLSETATAYLTVLSAQRRIEILNEHVASLDRLTPLLQQRIDAGASSPAEILRAQVAADLTKVERERAKTNLATARRELAVLMGDASPRFGKLSGQLANVGRPASFRTILSAIESNPQLMRWTAVRAQRSAELLTARLKPIPDVRVSVGWRHYRDSGDSAVRLGVSIPLPVWDQNQGDIRAAEETLAKSNAEQAINKAALIAVAGRSYEVLTGALQELKLLRSSVLPNSRKAVQATEDGYAQGRFTLLDLLDAQSSLAQAAIREQEALQSFHTAVTTIEGLIGRPFIITREIPR